MSSYINNIPYQASPELNVDIYQPENIEQLNAVPTVVWIHGGGWVSGSKEHARGYFKLLANQGFNVVSVDISLHLRPFIPLSYSKSIMH